MSTGTKTVTTLVLAVTFALAGWAYAGDNAGASFRMTGVEGSTDAGPGDTVKVQIEASGLVDVREMDIQLDVSPPGAFDLAETAYEVSTDWLVSSLSEGFGNDEGGGETVYFSAILMTAPGFTPETEARINIGRISLGASNLERDNFNGNDLGLSLTINPATAVRGENGIPTKATTLAQNFPNPFNPTTSIHFDLSSASSVTLRVYDAAGQVVITLIEDEFRDAGAYDLSWDGRTAGGDRVGSGIYFYRLRAGVFTSMKKMTLVQ